jgi:surfactin family lipopeptide synthetase A
MEVLGRIDHQVKVRGFRIELGEIETALAALPGIRQAVVVARDYPSGDRQLAAYVVGEAAAGDLRRSLQERLPDYMVPAAFVTLDALPLTPNGKVDRRALAKLPLEAGPRDGDGFVAPRNPVEEQMAEIWADVLGIERVGIHDTFWDLGGHSLLATRVLSRLYESLGVELPLQTLFENPTVAELSEAMGRSLLTTGGEEVDQFLADLEGLSEEELQELLRLESL